MNRRSALSLSVTAALGLASLSGGALAQQSDIAGVKAANDAFYSALSAHDINAMKKVWSSNANIRHIGPNSKTIDIGWDAINKDISGAFESFPKLSVSEDQPYIQVEGNFAFASGLEKVQNGISAGGPATAAVFGTSIFEKQGGRWLMIYHHASTGPQ